MMGWQQDGWTVLKVNLHAEITFRILKGSRIAVVLDTLITSEWLGDSVRHCRMVSKICLRLLHVLKNQLADRECSSGIAVLTSRV